ncbi:thiol:disulfide interchange protein TlpA [Salinarimonas rosea]|uniref:thiol:disulfide interchange protein TlpA n=1 Tax=Salinarimonas rosea TaxID=552063 RepID=UPI000694C0B0|nr:TlpA disulfide reductase family protein [Salinarimonas rosea]
MTDETSPRPSEDPRRGPRRGLILGAGALVVGAVVAFALVSRNSEAVAEACIPAQETLTRLAPTATGEVAAVSVHATPRLAPEIAFTGPEGEPLTLADFEGRTLLLNLWATWCAPCREEMPALDALQAEYGGEEFEVVAVNVDTRNLDRPRAWLEEHGIDDLAYYAENEGTLMQTLQRSGHVVGLPTTILVDGAGCELAVLKGPAEWASADAFALIRAALGREGG